LNTNYLVIFLRSVLQAAVTMLLCLVFGLPVALWMAGLSPTGRAVMLLLVTIPFWTNLLVRNYAWLIILREGGWLGMAVDAIWPFGPVQLLYNDVAVAIGLTYSFLPFMILPVYSVFEKFDWRLVEAAHDLGATRARALRRVILPVAMPGILAGSLLVFIPCLGAFVTPALLGGGKTLMLGNVIQMQFGPSRNWPFGAAISVVLLAIMLVAMTALALWRTGGPHEHPPFPLTREVSLFVLVYLYLPVFVLIGYSFNANRTATVWTHASLDWYVRILNNPSIRAATWNSLVLALSAGDRRHGDRASGRPCHPARLSGSRRQRDDAEAAADPARDRGGGRHADPFRRGRDRTWPRRDDPGAYGLLHSLRLPADPRPAGRDERSYEEAAQDLYANRFRTFRRVTLPLLWPGVLAGFTLAFVTSLDDFLTSFFLSGPGTTTLPVYIFSAIRAGITPEINAISTVMLVISILLVSLSFALTRLRR
jgi:spermidine/putrescine transport system permease protein